MPTPQSVRQLHPARRARQLSRSWRLLGRDSHLVPTRVGILSHGICRVPLLLSSVILLLNDDPDATKDPPLLERAGTCSFPDLFLLPWAGPR